MDILTLVGQVAQSGLMGAVAVIEGFVIYRLFMLLLTEKDKRLVDAQSIRDSVTAPLAGIQRTLDLISSKIDTIKNGK